MANPQPDEFTRISNELFEAIILADFKKRQLNIILLVIRLSYGCGRKYAVLRQSDFQVIGIDKSDIKKELDQLVQSGVLTITGERIALNKDYDCWLIPQARSGGPERFKQILKRNLSEKAVGGTPTNDVLPVGNSPTGPGSEGTERNIKETLKKGKEKETCMYDTFFEKFWTVYPRKVEKQRAYRCWKTRIREGLSEGLTMEGLVRDLVNAAYNYANECKRQNTQQRYIKHAATFLGPDKPYLDWINPPADEASNQSNEKKKLIQSLYMS